LHHPIQGNFIIRKKSLFSVTATSKDEIYAAATYEKLGSVLLYSSNQRKSWKVITNTIGSNFDLAVSPIPTILSGRMNMVPRKFFHYQVLMIMNFFHFI
jgi:hypothetical protein